MKKYLVVVVFALFGFPLCTRAASVVDIAFPVDGTNISYSDTFDAPRSGGRVHHATDIMAPKMTPVVAATDGVILFAPMEEPSYGYMIMLGGDDGYQYNYVHLNNDTPGTDDGAGGPEYAYAKGIEKGIRVTRGQQIGWLGDSGNAESVGSHLHFEMLDENENIVNPYASLCAAEEALTAVVYSFDPLAEAEAATSISDDLEILEAAEPVECEADGLIRTESSATVYYCGRDGGRYVFQDSGTFFSWYENFDDVETISDEQMGLIPLRGAVTYKPGTMIKIPSVPKVYTVGAHGTLHWIPSQTIAEALYGTKWASLVRDLPESFYPAYQIGADVEVE